MPNQPKLRLVVGQKLWLQIFGNHASGQEVEILSVGRKWATFKLRSQVHRVDADSWEAENTGYGHGRIGILWESKSEYDADLALNKAWSAFKRQIADARSLPEGLTIEGIAAARIAINLSEPEKV